MEFIILPISLFIFGFSIKNLTDAKNIKIEKLKEQDRLNQEIVEKVGKREAIKQEILDLSAEKERVSQDVVKLQSEIIEKNKEKEQISQKILDNTKSFQQLKERTSSEYSKMIEVYKQNMENACNNYCDSIEKAYQQIEDNYFSKKDKLDTEIEKTENDLNNLKETLKAGVAAQLREREKQEKINFYKLQISDRELKDIHTLENLKPSLNQPIVLSKLIWTSYFQKRTAELCGRVIGGDKSGIYKITNIITQQCYIGQSVNIADRIKQHIKCGLGIDAPATNKLYNAMQEYGVWNFTFELMEECSKDKLNERERFWIEMYESDKVGYNATKGNK